MTLVMRIFTLILKVLSKSTVVLCGIDECQHYYEVELMKEAEVSWLADQVRCWQTREALWALEQPPALCLEGITFTQRMATYHFSLLTGRNIRPNEKPLQMANVHVTCLRSNSLARSTAVLSLGVVLHHCDSVH